MSSNNSLNNGVNEATTDNCEGLSPGSCPADKQRGPNCHQNKLLEKDEEKKKTRQLHFLT